MRCASEMSLREVARTCQCLWYKSKYAHRRNAFSDYDPRPLTHVIVIESEDAMHKHLDIYQDPNTRFHVRI